VLPSEPPSTGLVPPVPPTTHVPAAQVSEQQSPGPVHAWASALHVEPAPPHVPPLQSLLQQSAAVVQVVPSALQLGATQADLVHAPVQHSAADVQAVPVDRQLVLSPSQTPPEHELVQQSL